MVAGGPGGGMTHMRVCPLAAAVVVVVCDGAAVVVGAGGWIRVVDVVDEVGEVVEVEVVDVVDVVDVVVEGTRVVEVGGADVTVDDDVVVDAACAPAGATPWMAIDAITVSTITTARHITKGFIDYLGSEGKMEDRGQGAACGLEAPGRLPEWRGGRARAAGKLGQRAV